MHDVGTCKSPTLLHMTEETVVTKETEETVVTEETAVTDKTVVTAVPSTHMQHD